MKRRKIVARLGAEVIVTMDEENQFKANRRLSS